jgi:hypothetical protein
MSDAVERPLETGWLPDTPVDDTLLRRFLHNQGDLVAALAGSVGGRVERDGDVIIGDADSPIALFNGATLLRPLAGPDDPVLDRVDAFFASGRGTRPWSFLSAWPTPDLSARGWSLMGHPAFVARPAGALGRPLLPDVEIRQVEAESELATFDRVVVDGYPLEEANGLPRGSAFPPAFLGSGMRCRIGYVDGEPAAAGASFVAHGIVNLCMGATLPNARRRGVWGALVQARMAEAADLPACAFTSDYSRAGFEHMGFLVLTRFTLYEVPAA